MKDIKFRGKRIDNGEWVYGSLTICNAFDLKDGIHKPEPLLAFIRKQNIEWLSNPDDKRWTFPSYKVIPETVGQYTGLKDKNGKDLDWWENDIFDDAGHIKVIVKDQGCFWFESVKSKHRIPCYQVAESDIWPHDIRNIGNIYENPI